MLPRPVMTGLVVLVTVMWAANLVVGWVDPSRASPYVNAIFGVVASAVWAAGRPATRRARQVRSKLAELIEPTLRPDSEQPSDRRGDQP